MRVAEHALAGYVFGRQVTCLFTDASLCHGWAGMVQTFWRATSDALNPQPLQAALRTARRGMEDQLATGLHRASRRKIRHPTRP